MIVFNNIFDIREFIKKSRDKSGSIGFIPTMGALHKGHMSLISEARNNKDIVIVSIFINPTQFNDNEDFIKYPVTTNEDISLLEQAGCHVLFLPSVNEVYPNGTVDTYNYDFDGIDSILEGKFRPGHFRGVSQIVTRLLDIVEPDILYLGQKDYQQCIIIKKLINQSGKNDQVKLIICPTVREADGLAMSSRNRRLTESQRALAGLLYQCLVSIQAKQFTDSFELVKKECMDLLHSKGLQPEYLNIANAENLSIMDDFNTNIKTVALIAVKNGDVRLIDNILL